MKNILKKSCNFFSNFSTLLYIYSILDNRNYPNQTPQQGQVVKI